MGANSPEEYGNYYAWGEIRPKEEFTWATYLLCNGTNLTMTKYCTKSSYGNEGFTDNITQLEAKDDAATANWGSEWQMPSQEQCDELFNSSYTQTTWKTQNGVNGKLITSKSNGNSIFLPASGNPDGSSVGSWGYYWSRSLNIERPFGAYKLYFDQSTIGTNNSLRGAGHPVRPVRVEKSKQSIFVDLGLSSGTLWATMNVGANNPEEFGDFFAWGETKPKEDYSWNTYKYCNGSNNTRTKYCSDSSYGYNGFTDNLTVLQPEDDAATVNWGEDWQMPTRNQFRELFNNSNMTADMNAEINGVLGYLITSTINGNSIFFPYVGYMNNEELVSPGGRVMHWTCEAATIWQSGPGSTPTFGRCVGLPVRAVRKQ